jgi:hypothetical protein
LHDIDHLSDRRRCRSRSLARHERIGSRQPDERDGGLPVLGLGLWQWPWVSAVVEAGLIAAGAWLYWSAAKGPPVVADLARARLVAWLIVIGGATTLALDVTGILG